MPGLPLSIAVRLRDMIAAGASVTASSMPGPVVYKMVEDGVIRKTQKGRTKASLFIQNVAALNAYLLNHFGINNLTSYIETLSKEELTRSEAVTVSGNSKLKAVRTFKGFLVNCYSPLEVELGNKALTIYPTEGTFTFIYDYETLFIPPGVIVVGMENPENFRYIKQQQHLFKEIMPLFVCRYPYSGDLLKWLRSIPNAYLHFGDLDFSGINIYLQEYKRHLSDKASFFIPQNAEELIDKYGNRELYNKQLHLIPNSTLSEDPLIALIELFHQYKKVLEQEVFIAPI